VNAQTPVKPRIPDAEEVVIELLDRIDWNRFDPGYKEYWEKTDHPSHAAWAKKRPNFLDSASLRVKTKLIKDGVPVRKGYRGKLHENVIYDESQPAINIYVGFNVVSTKPVGDVRITEDTQLTLTISSDAV